MSFYFNKSSNERGKYQNDKYKSGVQEFFVLYYSNF